MALNRILYSIIIFMNIIFVILFEHKATYAALYTVLLLPAISLLVLIIFKRRIYISDRLEANTVKKGEAVKYIISVGNNILKFRTKAVFNKKLRRLVKISEISGLNFEICADYRGVFNICADYILVYDPLCLFKFKIKNTGDVKLTVLPDIRSLENLPVSLNSPSDTISADGLFDEDYSGFPDFKKYSPSDGYKKIHWKLSARRGELISKNYHASGKNTAAVIINNSRFPENMKQLEKMRCEDIIIEAAVSVSAYCAAIDLSVYLDYIGGKPEETWLDFESLYIKAAGILFDGDEDFGDFLSSITETHVNADNIYIFTREVTDSIIDYAAKLNYEGRNAVIFYYTKKECKIWQITD